MTQPWCIKDEHHLYEQYKDFNEWLDSDEGIDIQEANGIDGLAKPSKAFYASDKEAYRQAYKEYRKTRRYEVLGESHLTALCSDKHWFQRNLDHFFQLVSRLEANSVVPFIGAGLSVEGGFPTWQEHLKNQGRTAGLDASEVDDLLNDGKYELIIAEIEEKKGKPVFIQEIRDAFDKVGSLTNTMVLVSELFKDTLITTNYDALIEQAFDIGEKNEVELIDPFGSLKRLSAKHTSVIKLHGDINQPSKCILGKNQYDEAYGADELNMSLPIPKMLARQYRDNSLLFLGCSLHNDRTVEVFKKIKKDLGDVELPQHFSLEQTPDTEEELAHRNAYLANIGITPIWFEQERFEYIEQILQLAVNELRYKKSKVLKPDCYAEDKKEEQQESPFAFVNNLYWIRDNWKSKKFLVASVVFILIFTSLPIVYSNYNEIKKIFKSLTKSEPNKDIKITLDHVFYSGNLFNGYYHNLFNLKHDRMNNINISNDLMKCFTVVGFQDTQLLSYRNISDKIEINYKSLMEVRAKYEGYILKKDIRMKPLFYSGFYLSELLYSQQESTKKHFLKEWFEFKKMYEYKLPYLPLEDPILGKNDLVKKSVETHNILYEFFSIN